ncbi:hypothetical protein D3C81_1891350 [compost metagenome]
MLHWTPMASVRALYSNQWRTYSATPIRARTKEASTNASMASLKSLISLSPRLAT